MPSCNYGPMGVELQFLRHFRNIRFMYNIYIYMCVCVWQGPFGIMRPSSFLIPLVYLSPYFSISIAILLSGRFRSKESPCLPFLTSLSIAQCSSFWWLWGQDSSPICFRTRLSSSLSYVAVLSGCFRGTVCSLSSVCLRACPPYSLQLVPLLTAPPLSLLFFSLGAYLGTGSSLVLPCPPLFPPTCLLNPLPIAAAGGRMDFLASCVSPCLFPLFRSHSLTLSLYHALPYLPSYLSPTCLLILSPLPCFFPGLQHLGQRG